MEITSQSTLSTGLMSFCNRKSSKEQRAINKFSFSKCISLSETLRFCVWPIQ